MKDLDELDRLHAAATAGEWVVRSYQEPSGEFFPAPSWEVYDEDNLALTAALYAAWPSVSARLRAAEAENAKLRHHYDAAAPEHNLLAVLDLYEGRRLEAVAEVERLRGEAEAFRACIRQREAAELVALADVDELRAECERLRGALREACSHLDMAVEASEESGDLDEIEAQEERDFIKGLRAALGEP